MLTASTTLISRRRLLAGGLALSFVAGSLAACGASAPTNVPPATAAAFPGNGTPPLLADANWLRQQSAAKQQKLRILDLSDLATYRAGHVPGAVHAWWQDAMALNYPTYGVVRFEQDPINDAHSVITGWGINDATHVIAYDNKRNRYAAAIVWWLRALGHSHATVLDGGLAAWRGAGGRATTKGTSAARATDLTLKPDKTWLIGTVDLKHALGRSSLVIVDTRTADELNDTINDTVKRGRIPGAVAIPWTSTLRDQAGRLKPPDQLRQLYLDAGVLPQKTVVVYGRFGIEAAQSWLVLSLLGYQHIRLYDQGWAQWGASAGVPIAPP